MKRRKFHGVLIADYDALVKTGVDLYLLGSAIDDAKKSRHGFSWAQSGGKLVTAELDESGKRLLAAEIYLREATYRDPEEAEK